MKKLCSLRGLVALVLSLMPLLTMSCGTLEIGIERTPTPGTVTAPATVALATEDMDLSTREATPSSTREPTPTPIPASTELRVAFVKVTEHGNNAWLWREETKEAVSLTKDGGVGGVKISDDGEIVAFTRGDGLWMIRSDGADGEHPTEERELVSAEEFAAIEPREAFGDEFATVLNYFEWIPGTHILAFNTRLRMEIGLTLNDDLHLVNADTLERATLLQSGEGGEFTYSPDGRKVAISTPGTISLVDADGSGRREVFTYTPVATHSEFQYYAKPVWAADSSSLRVAIPPADPFAEPSSPTSIWSIPADGTPASKIGNIATGQMKESFFSPDLRYVAHLNAAQSDPESTPMTSLLITSLDKGQAVTYYPQTDSGTQVTLDSGETITLYPEATLIYGWAPDSLHFAFLTYSSELPPQVQIGQLGVDATPIYSDADAIIDVRWVDADRYLFLAQGPRGLDILLGHLQFGGLITSVAGVVGDPPAYDFAAPPYDVAPPEASTDQPTPTPSGSGESPVPFGLVYQTGNRLWHVNSDGESVQIFDRPGGVISPDSAKILYTEADDVWLADVATGERRNLTQTPDWDECCAQWWPGQPDIILFNSSPPENEGPNYGYPAVVRLDGSDYRVLDDQETSFALPAPSPDGRTVAYDRASQAWLYRLDTGIEPFDLAPYGLSSDPQVRVVSPAWSPDGQRLAWIIGDCRQGECQYSVGVFGLTAPTLQLLHPYTPVGRGGQPSAPAWSPDGGWLAFGTWASDPEDRGLWVVRADGQGEEEIHVDGSPSLWDPNPVWSPDGRWLAFSSTPEGVGSGIWLAEVGTWELHPLDLLPDATLMGWASPPGRP
jgi:Tol biopolymer transport system component